MVAFCRRRQIEMPLVNANFWIPGRVRPIEADFAWVEQRYMIETDGPLDHDGELAQEEDAERDLLLKAAHWRVDRLRRKHLRTRPDDVERMILANIL